MDQASKDLRPNHRRRPVTGWAIALALLLVLAACDHEKGGFFATATPAGKPAAEETSPETAPPPPAEPARAKRHMIVAGHPLAAEAGRKILRAGGSAIDAAIAAQMVLTLVEPQSSGIGGGAFLLHYAAKTGAIDSYDGRETAPKSANPYMFLDGAGKPLKWRQASVGGLGVGVPGLLRMLELAHRDHGRLPWRDLFRPAIELAAKGFPISKRLARQIAGARHLLESPVAGTYFFANDGTPKKEGTVLVNRDLADTLRRIAREGADAFYAGEIAKAIVRTVTRAPKNPAAMTVQDLASYEPKKRPPVCLPYRRWLVCGMGPPSSGGIALLQILGMVQKFDLAALGPGTPAAIHLISEASRLAFADRNVYIADPDFVPVPLEGLLDPAYLSLRASGISTTKALGKRQPGMPGIGARLSLPPESDGGGFSTAHISVIDADGNAVSMTSSIERVFGSRLMTRGFMLNNQLTDFAFAPNANGAPVANRVMPGKRPRSSMSPTLVFDGQGSVVMAVGSPGGSRIIGYVTKAVIAALDWKLNAQAAVDYPNFLNRNGPLEIEEGTPLAELILEFEALGHEVRLLSRPSGLNAILVTGDGLEGGTDKRREGKALGD
ncbi:MAG: gamma-glutamyltransferase [Proteobacteria bacterium]|nr:gamma-glutamyltransferase [Pseudomonadota bacterium]